MKYKLLITTLFSMITINCFADEGYSFSTGNYFYEHCKNINATNPATQKQVIAFAVNLGGCYTAAQTAFDDVINIGYLWTSSPNAVLCFYDYYDIEHIPSQQILDMTLKYIKNNPERRNAKIGMIVAHMMSENFPFPKSCLNKN